MIDIKAFLIKETEPLREAFKITSRSFQIAFVVDDNEDFKGVITDGDIRRAVFAGANLNDAVKKYYNSDPVVFDEKGSVISKKKLEVLDHPEIYIFPVLKDRKVVGYRTSSSLQKIAFVTGITGQDGAYLAKFLLDKRYKVIGGYRRSSTDTFERLKRLDIFDKVELVTFDILDLGSCLSVLGKFQPSEIYNLAAQSFVYSSFSEPVATLEYNAKGTLNVLEAIRIADPKIRFYQASSSEMFGRVTEIPQRETTPFYPLSPYASSKVAAHWLTVNYRESYDIFACSGILFNHESPLRGLDFVTRKITHGASCIKLGMADRLSLGNLGAKRDWGYSYDYVKAMWAMLQQDEAEDFVIATGKSYSVEQFLEKTFNYLELDYKKYVKVDDKYYRPNDVDLLLGDPSKAKSKLGWEPKVDIDMLVKLMVDSDMALLNGNAKLGELL